MMDFVPDKLIKLRLNSSDVEATVSARMSLTDFLRYQRRLTGTHLGCEQGVCGACTVLLNGEAVRSCLLLAIQADGSSVTTIEGLTSAGELDLLADAFRTSHALQCGFCTPGMVVAAYDLLRRYSSPSEWIVRKELSGNLCRCTGYEGIIDAVLSVAATRAMKAKRI